MNDCFSYTPGMLCTFYQEVKDGYNQRTDDGYIPVITRVILPNFMLDINFPQPMVRFDVGLYYFQYKIPAGAIGIGTYFVDIVYMDPDSFLLVNASKQIFVISPFGNFSSTTF